MKHFKIAAAFVGLCAIAISCNETSADKTTEAKTESTEMSTVNEDPAKLKAEIQDLENAWANADNKRDVNALAAFYSEDAVSMGADKPMLVGNAAIKKDLEEGFATRQQGSTVSYDVIDVFGSGNYATETGKYTRKDASGKTELTGKYMAIWEKRDGKWICIRDISNEDAKKK